MTRDAKRLLGGYATDTLTEDERRELLRAALEDQALFDAITEEEGLRELLESPGTQQEVRAALEKPTAWQRVRGCFGRPATFGDVVAVAAVLLAVVGYRVLSRERPPDLRPAASSLVASAASPATRARLLALPEQQVVRAGLELEAHEAEAPFPVRPGKGLRLRLSVQAPARLLVIAERSDGSSTQVFPASGSPPALVERQPGGGPVIRHVPLTAPAVPGARRVRLVVAPVDVDLGAATPVDVDRLAPRLTLVDLTFEVIAP